MCQKRNVELCVAISAGATYRVAEMQRLVSHPLLRSRAVHLPPRIYSPRRSVRLPALALEPRASATIAAPSLPAHAFVGAMPA